MPDVTVQLEPSLWDGITVPGWVTDLAAFSRWVESPEFPTEGRVSYISGHIRVDLSMEQLYTHNQVKLWISIVLAQLGRDSQLGTFIADRMRLANATADLSTEPDGMFVTFESQQAGRLKPVAASSMPGIREVEGTPDMVLEVLSESSEAADRGELAEAYFRAGVLEYWLADARGEELTLELYHRGRKGFVKNKPADGWVRSQIFDRAFRLVQSTDPLGNPQYTLEHRA
jgi:Uma2 family endonuclease